MAFGRIGFNGNNARFIIGKRAAAALDKPLFATTPLW